MASELIVEQPPTPARKRRWWLWVIGGLLVAALLAAGGFVLWASNPAPPMAQALAAMQGTDAGRGARIIGRATAAHPGTVVMKTIFGGGRIVDMLVGEQLPRIC